MKILIVGAGGQLGRSLQARLTSHELSALTRGRLDLTRLDEVRAALSAHRPDLLINAAAYTNVDGAESDPEGAYRGNALAPRNAALATSERGIPCLHVSTDYVFDGAARRPYHEFDRPCPQSVYGASKLAGEAAVAALNPRHYLVRTAWLYHPDGRNFPLTMLQLAARPEVRVVDDQRGSPTYAPHLAEAIGRLVETGSYGTYHLAGSGGATWFELTCALYRHRGIRTPVRPVTTDEFPRPAPRPAYSVLTTIQDPQILLPPWEQGLAEFSRSLG